MNDRRRLLTLGMVLVLALAITATASGAPDCDNEKFADNPACQTTTSDPTTTTTTAPEDWSDCSELGWGDPIDLSLDVTAGSTSDCNDIGHQSNGAVYTFTFGVTPQDEILGTPFVMAIRSSVPGDWCNGMWTYRDASDNILIEGAAGAITPREVGSGYTATLVLDEVLIGTNCTSDGEVNWSDSNPDWVLTLMQGGGRPLRGSQAITVTWNVTPPTG